MCGLSHEYCLSTSNRWRLHEVGRRVEGVRGSEYVRVTALSGSNRPALLPEKHDNRRTKRVFLVCGPMILIDGTLDDTNKRNWDLTRKYGTFGPVRRQSDVPEDTQQTYMCVSRHWVDVSLRGHFPTLIGGEEQGSVKSFVWKNT